MHDKIWKRNDLTDHNQIREDKNETWNKKKIYINIDANLATKNEWNLEDVFKNKKW